MSAVVGNSAGVVWVLLVAGALALRAEEAVARGSWWLLAWALVFAWVVTLVYRWASDLGRSWVEWRG